MRSTDASSRLGSLDHRGAPQLAAGLEHACRLRDRRRWIWEAVKTRAGDAQLQAAVFERQRLDVGLDELDPVNATTVGLGAGPAEHAGREVAGHVLEMLLGSQAAERDTAAARDVEHAGARRQLGEAADVAVEGRGFGAPDQATQDPARRRPPPTVARVGVRLPARRLVLQRAA
jgi:hypothetical protein